MTKDMKTILTRLFTVIMLMMFSMGVSAVDVELNKEYKGGKVKVKSQEDQPDGSTLVTITVAPGQGFTITHSDKNKGIIVVALRPTGGQSGTRAPQIAGDLDVKGPTETVSYPNSVDYQFTVPAGLNAWVQDIKFQDSGRKGDGDEEEELGYSGTYYIRSGSTRKYPDGDYYLCPTENWAFFHATNSVNSQNNGQPFLTTHLKDNEKEAKYYWWIIEKHTEGDHDYYAFKYSIDYEDGGSSYSRYLSYNRKLTGAGTDRMRIHLKKTETPGDYELFDITTPNNKTYLIISPKKVDEDDSNKQKYLVVNGGNTNYFKAYYEENEGGVQKKENGPSGFTLTTGIIGTYNDIADLNAPFYLEDVVDRPTITINGSGQVEISAEAGTTIYYTTNDTKPTETTGEEYSTAFPIPAGATAIKAIAMNSDGVVSKVAILPLLSYTYNIVDTQGHIAIKYTVKQPAGLALSDNYTSIPEAIRSPYLENEEITYYSTFTEGSRTNLSGEISSTPAEGGDIYVSYTTAHLNDIDIPLHLNGSNPYKIQVYGEYIYDENKNLMHSGSDGDDADKYRWVLKGSDPYRVQIQNVKSSTHHFKWSTNPSASLTLGASSNFIILGGSGTAPEGFNDQVELMAATGADISSNAYYNVGRPSESNVGLLASGAYGHGHAAIQVLLEEVQKITTFHIIDMSGHIVVEQSGAYGSLTVPVEWRSPLVKENGYHYWKHEDFRVVNGVYTKLSGVEEIDNFLNAPTDIYVTYDPKDENDEGFKDLDGSENRATDGKKYLLRFAGGTSFRQEKGDGFEASEAPGIYPYINGEGGLFVYGQAKLEAQAEEVASTRTRWAWYLEGGDPYRLRISTLQTRTDGNTDETLPRYSYLRTYMPKGYNKVVTGVISNKPEVYDASDDAHAVRHKPTDYMILNGTNGHFKLVTSDVVDDYDDETVDVRHTVTSFENYWKTNPTALDALINNAKTNNPLQRPNPDLTDAVRKNLRTELGNQIDSDGLTQEQQAVYDGLGWHTYNVWAYGSTWTRGKEFHYEPHWFKTIDVGTETDGVYNGDFDLVEYDLDGALILLDQHGWEVMRKPITNLSSKKADYANAIKKYDSPMVRKYHFWTNFKKEDGYHKYKPIRGVSSSKDAQEKGVGTSLTEYPEVLSTGTLADIYVTYEVMATYRDGYTCAQAENGPQVSQYLIRQGENYAKTPDDGTSIALELEPVANVTDVSAAGSELLWYVKPNINIDTEMGYNYEGNYGEKTQTETESDYFTNKTDDAVYDKVNGQNGFDPYNLQIESVAQPGKLFTTNAVSTARDPNGGLKSVYADPATMTVTLQSYTPPYPNAATDYYDTQELHVTNSTFMAVSDDNGNIRLMPRFDHHNVVESFATLETQQNAEPYGDEEGTQTTLFVLPTTSSSTPSGDPIDVSSSDEITDMNGYYRLRNGFNVTKVIGTKAKPFKGTIDGQLYTIDGLGRPLVAYAEGDATIKNVIVKMASINAGNADGNAGAICCQATGNTRIYNCGILPNTIERDEDGNVTGFSGSHVSGSTNVGGIVGQISGNARVINCFSYATITGGTTVAGIVGNNMGTTTAASITTMVMNCMFYGDITAGTNVSPVYGGNNIANLQGGLNTFNYYAYDKLKTKAISDNKYNSALAVEEKYLNRFEFYRLLLNSNKKLATFYVTGSADDDNLMAKWVLETADRSISGREPYPYPILKAQGYYPSIINYDAINAPDSTSVGRNHGGKLPSPRQTLSVTISGTKTDGGQTWPTGAGITTSSLELKRTDKDFDRFNYNYDKVQLPYYNDVGSGNYTGNRVVTGWKITAMGPSTEDADPYTSANYPTTGITDYPNHNYADRKSRNKDLYTVSGRVFSQGAYFDVPYGVTSITIEPYWGKAYYIADLNYDVVYKADYTGKQNVTQTGTQVTLTGQNATRFNGQKVETSITRALDAIDSNQGLGGLGPTVYDNALVLVGNLHLDVVPLNGSRPFTMMSVDEDNDHEPDYSLIYHHKGRSNITPIRFDFLAVPGTAQAQKPNGASLVCNFTIFKTRGWFEVTNTAFMYSSQIEYENGDLGTGVTKMDAPLILLGGVFDQFVSTQSSTVDGHTTYIHIGSNVWINSFGLGTHSDGSQSTPHVPVSVTGGEYPGFYLTGTYNANANVRKDNAECYISGGYFHEAAGAAQEAIDGNVRWQIYNADIDNFFGGGTNDAKPITGDVTVDIYNSHVTTYCGGPKFGNMQGNKKVTTNADGCVFGTYFGAGFGGLSYSRKKYYDNTTPAWGTTLQGYFTTDRGKYFDGSTTNSRDGGTGNNQYGKKGPGVATDFDYESFVWSDGRTGGRFFVKFASFSLAQCNDVESILTNCTINGNFYGGGSLGKVVGTVDSELDGCTVKGNVFGAGFSATLPTLEVRDGGFTKVPKFNSASGMFEPGEFSGTTTFQWENGTFPNNNSADPKFSSGKVTTNIDLQKSNLGSVDGDVNLTLKGETTVGTLEGNASSQTLKGGTGNVYGGGESSYVTGASHKVTVLLQGKTEVFGNVFGGGDEGLVEGSTEVKIAQPTTNNTGSGTGTGEGSGSGSGGN